MKNRLHIIKSALLLIIIVSLYSCGPVVNVLNIESRIPAKYPIDLKDKSISIFVSIDTSNNIGNYLHQNDSLRMVAVATGIAKELEYKLTLDEGAVFIFNHYPSNKRVYDMEYIQNLSFLSNSDIVVILDSLEIGVPKLVDNIARSSRDQYGSYFIYAPISTDTKIYDGTSANLLARINQIDTVYWELYSRNDIREAAMIQSVNNSTESIAQNIGQEIVKKMFPSWIEQQRSLFVYSNSIWNKAYDFAAQFMWQDAMDLWLKQTTDPDNIKVAAAAFNMAVACELTDRLDLALEWIELSYKSYPFLPGVVSYKQFLKEKIEIK